VAPYEYRRFTASSPNNRRIDFFVGDCDENVVNHAGFLFVPDASWSHSAITSVRRWRSGKALLVRSSDSSFEGVSGSKAIFRSNSFFLEELFGTGEGAGTVRLLAPLQVTLASELPSADR
jgi:hypothetical protein